MPATTPEALALKRERDNERRREQRRTDPDYRHAELKARRKRAASSPRKPPPRKPKSIEARKRARARASEQKRAAQDARPFVGVDGEGIGGGADQRYALFRMGERELYDDDRRLTTAELLAFITDHPDPRDLLVAFAFDYDANMILRDLPADRWKHLLKMQDPQHDAHVIVWRRWRHWRNLVSDGGEPIDPNPYQRGGWTWYRPLNGAATFGLQYIPRNHLMVCRGLSIRQPGGKWRTESIPGSVRTIYDTFANFQSSFLTALNRWSIGAEHWPAIAAGKAGRGKFPTITKDVRRYCAIECDLLAQMMAAFRAACLAGGIRPKTWNGAGKLAAALLTQHGAMKSKEVLARHQPGLLAMAHEAYYGGRFEVTRVGAVDVPVHEHDINSAYPAAMLDLPCLEHGTWRKTSGAVLSRLESDAIFVAPVSFAHPHDSFLCGLPFRSPKDGRLSWPRFGRGVYWSPEIRSAQKLGAKVKLGDGWLYHRNCSCRPYAWIEALYNYRRSLGKSTRGQPLKLGYNGCYGKKAQRIGNPAFANPIDAGLITALTRAKLNEAIVTAGPRSVVMIATDGLYTVGRRPALARGDGLGEWEYKRHRSLFIVRPGLYWPPKPRGKDHAVKSRGVSPKFFVPMVPKFRRVWRDHIRARRGHRYVDLFESQSLGGLVAPSRPPVVQIEVETFIGHRLALTRNDFESACRWKIEKRNQAFEVHNSAKRGEQRLHRQSIILGARVGDPHAKSASYQAGKVLTTASEWVLERMLFEAMPDHVDLTAPFID